MFEYQGFATLGVNLNRQKYGPLDISNVFTSLTDLNYYLSKGANKEGVSDYWKNTVPYPYPGQYVALVDNTTRTVTPYMLKEKADGTFEAINLGVPEVDGETIKINDEGKLEAIIPEFEDTNTTYELKVEGVEGGIKITLTPSEGEVQSYTINDPDLSDYITSGELTEALANKADKSDVYTKTETDKKIGDAVAAADHLKRKIVDSVEDIDLTAADAMQYIYMVPSGLQASDNKYYEYIVLEEDGNKYVEQVGSWEVDLTAYLTKAAAEETYAKKNDVETTYAKKTDLDAYVTDTELSTTLSDYATKNEIPTDYVSASEFATEMAKYETAEVAAGKYADKTLTEQAIGTLNSAVTTLQEVGAEKNIIATVSSDFKVTEDRKLELVSVPQNVVSGLSKTTWSMDENGEFLATTAPATLSEILVPANFDETSGKGQSGLMTAEQAQKLSALVIGEGGIEISGKVNAENVEGLSAWITNNRDNVPGLLSTTTQTLITNLNNTINNEETGVVTRLTAVETKALEFKEAIDDHDLRLEVLEKALQWQTIEE